MEIKFRGQRIDNNEWVYGYYRKGTNIQCYTTILDFTNLLL